MNSYTIKYRDLDEVIEHTADAQVIEGENGMAILSDDDGAVTFAVPLDRLLSITRTPADTTADPAGPGPDIEAPVGWTMNPIPHAAMAESLKARIHNAGFDLAAIVPDTVALLTPLELHDSTRRVSFVSQTLRGRARYSFEYDSSTTPPIDKIRDAIIAAGYEWDKVQDDSLRPRYTGGRLKSVEFDYLKDVVEPAAIVIPQ